MDTGIKIDTQMPYHWKPEYLDLYIGLRKARESGKEMTNDEKKLCEWLSYGFTNYLFKRI